MLQEDQRKMSVEHTFGCYDIYQNKNNLATILRGMTLACSSGYCLGFIYNYMETRLKSRQNQFATKIAVESVLNNLIDLQMFSKQVVHRRGK